MFSQLTQRSSNTQQSGSVPTKPTPKGDSHGRLSILQVATLNLPIRSGLGYGPIETIIYNLDKGLHALGHRSIVACSADSRVVGEHCVTTANAIGTCAEDDSERQLTSLKHLELAFERANRGDIDLVHFHDANAVDYFMQRLPRRRLPMVRTLHVAADERGFIGPDRWNGASNSLACVASSEHQRRNYRRLTKVAYVVHYGIDVDDNTAGDLNDEPRYLFAIGRITRSNGQEQAIELAKRTGSKLIIAGCVRNTPDDRKYFANLRKSIDLETSVDQRLADADYYREVIKPVVATDKQIIYIGELCENLKAQWYRHALATVFPVQQDEPYGLVVTESMAFGTPVIAYDRGSVSELVGQGTTGFVVDSMSAMIGAVGWVDTIDRAECRNHIRRHFSIARMTDGYSGVYRQILQAESLPGTAWQRRQRPSISRLFPLTV